MRLARRPLWAAFVFLGLSLRPVPASSATVPSPSEFLGFQVGADRTLADYRQISSYFRKLASVSPRVQVVSTGRTTLGEEMLMAVISSEENLKNQKRIREIARKLADPRGLSEAETAALASEGKVVLLVTCAIHASEIGSTQMAMEWAHALATAEDAVTTKRLQDVVLLLVPSLNPDGQLMETDWYRKNLGTKFEGGRMPWLYHPYVGHDNNRDWYMLTQKESKALSGVVYHDWFPQVWLDEHQMGWNGPRIFVPPYSEPVDPDIHPLVWREVNLIGANMAFRLEQAGKAGVIYGYAFDAYWIGGTKNTAWWKNISGLLTEVASSKVATPVRVEEGELSGGRKGLVEYGVQTNFPNPWPGGWWRLRDIMDYERIASDALLEVCSERREEFLKDMAARARAAIGKALPGEAYRIPAEQRDGASGRLLARLMVEHGVEVLASANGDAFLPLAQPYGPFVREMMEPQRYPEVKLVAGKEIVFPYDVAAWTLPLLLGVTVEKTTLPDRAGLVPFDPSVNDRPLPDGAAYTLDGASPESAKVVQAALRAGGKVRRDPVTGTFTLDPKGAKEAAPGASAAGLALRPVPGAGAGTVPVSAPRVGLYKPWTASMDEGWTRFVLEQYGFAPKTLDNKAIRAGKLGEAFDVIVLPSVDREVMTTGKPKREEGEMRYLTELPPEYQGGLEKEGAAALKAFVEEGGTIVALGASTGWVINEFNIPVRNTLARVKREEFSCPGSLLRARVEGGHPVTWGLPSETAVFVDEAIAFQTSLPGGELSRWTLASYPHDARDVLMSGWIAGEEKLTRKAAAVATTFGKGKLVLFGFRPQMRAQTHATFPFLFNALWWGAARE